MIQRTLEMTEQETFTLKFRVDAVPVAQPRPQPGVIKGANRAFMKDAKRDHPIWDFKSSVRQAFKAACPYAPPVDEPVEMHLEFVMPRPDSMRWKKKPMPRIRYSNKKNDWDNLGKGVCDALNQLAFVDDGLIWRCVVERWVASGEETPHVMVTMIKETPWQTDEPVMAF